MKIWRQIWVSVLGGLLVLLGLVMMVTPGPGLLAIAGGVAILATEFMWAKELQQKIKARIELLKEKAKAKRRQP